MTKSLKLALFCLSAAASNSGGLLAQSIPAGVGSTPTVGFQLPQLNGSFNYSLSASELISSSFYGSRGVEATTSLSGAATYLSSNTRRPFSAIYSGGVLLANSGQPTTTYQSLALSQGYVTKNWNFDVQDQVSYLPESPVNGLSGIPGVGDLGINPIPIGADAGLGILTSYGPRVSNTASGSASRFIGKRVSAQASGYYSIQRFIGDNSNLAVDSSSDGGTGGVTYHFDGRSSMALNYSYTQFNYTGTQYAFTTQSGTVDYTRHWTRRFLTDVYAGPQHIASADPAFGAPSTQITAGAAASYDGRSAFYTLSYTRGVNNGSGAVIGSFSDNIVAAARHQFGRRWGASASLGYSRSTGLPSLNVVNFSNSSVELGGQAVHTLGRKLSAYASYTVEHQTTSGNVPLVNGLNVANGSNLFSGFYQILGVGISYSPGQLFLNR